MVEAAELELLVHLHRNRLPPNFVCFGVEVPEHLDIREVHTPELPTEWRLQPGPQEFRDLGTQWVEQAEAAVLRVPSTVVPGEHDFLLNPRHPDFSRLMITDPEPFDLDVRLLG